MNRGEYVGAALGILIVILMAVIIFTDFPTKHCDDTNGVEPCFSATGGGPGLQLVPILFTIGIVLFVVAWAYASKIQDGEESPDE
jgi:hypothetical protein